jgi:hypothetical protein
MHPAQLLLGSVLVAEEVATRNRQLTFASLCHDAVAWAVETRDLLREIASDAAYGADLMRDAMADGSVSPTEAARIRGVFTEIEEEALTGRIIA